MTVYWHRCTTGLLLTLTLCLSACAAPTAAPAPTVAPPTSTPKATQGHLLAQAVDGPDPARLVFSRVGPLDAPSAAGHSQATVRLSNTGTAPLVISALPLTGAWALNSGVSLPLVLAPGASVGVSLTFTADFPLTTPVQLLTGSLDVVSDDPAGTQTITLAGVWQPYPEHDPAGGYSEPVLELIKQAFGYTTVLSTSADAARPTNRNDGSDVPINQRGWVHAQGEEVLAAYWQRADSSQPVQVEELASYERQGTVATLAWYPRGSRTLTGIITHAGLDSQTILPRQEGDLHQLAQGTFRTEGVFGFNATAFVSEWSDPSMNAQAADQANGCPGPCGQHLRFWPVRTSQGVQANTYLLAVDYNSINDDYQDDLYLIRNVQPVTP